MNRPRDMDGMTIGQMARSVGASVETIRFYERKGLLPPPARSASGYRIYPPETGSRLRLIRQAKDLGFSLAEIKELLALRVTPGRSCRDVRLRTQRKIADIEQRIAALRRMKAALLRLVTACIHRGRTSECPILEALESD